VVGWVLVSELGLAWESDLVLATEKAWDLVSAMGKVLAKGLGKALGKEPIQCNWKNSLQTFRCKMCH